RPATATAARRSSPTACRRSPERPRCPAPRRGASASSASPRRSPRGRPPAATRPVQSSQAERPTSRQTVEDPPSRPLRPMPKDDLETLARLRGLLDVSRVVRDEEALPDMLRAIARTIAESLGYKVVVINLYRPAWDEFEVTTVHDYDHKAVEALMGTRGGWSAWKPLLDERFERRGAYFVRAGEYNWDNDMLAVTPDIPISDDP